MQINKLKISLLILFLLLSCWPRPASSVEQTKKETITPLPFSYRNALERLKDGDFNAALGWLEQVKRQMPASNSSLKADILRGTIFLSRELAFLVASKNYLAGRKLAIVGSNQRPEIEQFSFLSSTSIKKGMAAGDLLLSEVEDLISEDKRQKLLFNISVPLNNLQLEKIQQKIRRGVLPDEAEQKKLEKGLFLTNFLNILSDIIGVPANKMLLMPYRGQLNRTKLYLTLGSRLAIIASARSYDDKRGDFERLAINCLDKVLSLTPKDKFNRDRLRAIEIKQKISERQKIAKPKKCSKCQRIMKSNWKYCPFDGTKIGK